VLLSHDQHGDNLDALGRALLPSAGVVLTTQAGGRRLSAVGLRPWATFVLAAPDRPTVEVTATPGRHGPPLSRPVTGDVIGFALRWDGQEHGALWITGDTVPSGGVREVPARVDVGTMLLHLGAVRFGVTGPVRYTMTAREGVSLCQLARPRTVLPVHYEGWSHFREGRNAIEEAFAAAPAGVRDSLRWLPLGMPARITA
jgi:L-ascorbate metabolism protein UlaG (beta-lactamase superfamily)